MAKVFLSAGHGGSDTGACANGLKEKDINLQTLLACRDVLTAHGVQTVCSRTRDENDPVGQEVREANASGASLAVSFHANAGGGHGFEGYYYASDKNGRRLVEIATRRVAELGQEAHGAPAKSGNHLMFVNSTKMTAVLFESFFVDSSDRAIGDTVAEQRAFGVAYAKAILEYLGIAYQGTGGGGSSKPKPSAGYYKAFNSQSIVDGLKSIGVNSSFANRKKIAKANGIANYSGTAAQNGKLCGLARQGRLKKA